MRLRRVYRKWLAKLAKRELKAMGDLYDYRFTRAELVHWHDLMAIQSVNQETPAERRILGIMVQTAMMLDNTENDNG